MKNELNRLYEIIRAMNFVYRVRHNGKIKFRLSKLIRKQIKKQ